MTAMTAGALADTDCLEADRDPCRPQRVLVVDESELIQAGLRALLAGLPWVDSCLLAGSAEQAVQVVRRRQPQLVLVSASLEDRSSEDLCSWLREHLPHIRVVLLANEGRIPAALAHSLGAAGALSKHMPRHALVDALQRVAEGARVYPKCIEAPGTQLSQRELDVLRHLAMGQSNPEIGRDLNLSRHTVKQHTSAVYRKLGVLNRAAAAIRAQELGLLAPGSALGRLRPV